MNPEEVSSKFISDRDGAPSASSDGYAKTPVLWALVALAYLFELGAVAILVSAGDILMQPTSGPESIDVAVRDVALRIFQITALAAAIVPILAMCFIIFFRFFYEDLFYMSDKLATKRGKIIRGGATIVPARTEGFQQALQEARESKATKAKGE